jgi:hypothetical protein
MEQAEQVTEIITIWYIRNNEDRMWQSVMFKSREEAQRLIDGEETMEDHEPYSVQFPVRYSPKQMDYAARQWVAECYEYYSIGSWSTEDCWEFIEQEHFGGRGGFILNTCLDKVSTR